MKRYMARNERSGCPSSFVAFDTETIPVADLRKRGRHYHKFHIGVGIAWRIDGVKQSRVNVERFTEARAMLHWIYRQGCPRKRTWVVAHNIGFDLTAIQFWRALERKMWRPNWKTQSGPTASAAAAGCPKETACMVIDDPPTILDMKTDTGRSMVFVDLMNYFPMKLKDIGEALGIQKLPMPGDEATEEDWFTYCERDVRIVQAAVCELVRMVRKDDLGNMRYTTSGQSMALFRHRCLSDDIVIGYPDKVKELERRSFYGMPTTCYYHGKVGPRDLPPEFYDPRRPVQSSLFARETIYRLDVNSCYPFLMRDNVFPVEYVSSAEDLTPKQLSERLECLEGVAEVVVESAEKTYPYRDGGDVIWAVGRFPTALCGPELRAALAARHVVSVSFAQFYRGAKCFRKFVNAVWKLRENYAKKGLHFQEKYAKAMSVSLHGKFGQRNQRWESVPGVCPPFEWGTWSELDYQTGEYVSWRSIAGTAQRLNGHAETSGNMPIIASYVLAYARCWLARAIACAGPRNVYYHDADSVHTTAAGFAELTRAGWIHPTCYGSFKIEGEFTEAEYRGPKNYRLGSTWTIAGVRDQHLIDQFGVCHDTHFSGLVATIIDGPPPGPITDEVSFPVPPGRVRGTIGTDGWIRPPRIVCG